MSGICQANKNCGKKCTFKAKKEYGNIYCGVHKIYYQVVEAKAAAAPADVGASGTSNTSGEPAPVAPAEPAPIAPDLGDSATSNTSSEPVPAANVPTVAVVNGILTVKFNKQQAIAHFKKINYGDLPCYMEPLYVCMRRARETMDDEQLEIFEKNPRANVIINDSPIYKFKERYDAYRRGIDFYYETIIPIIHKYRKDKKNQQLYGAIAWHNFFTNERYAALTNNKSYCWNGKSREFIIEIID
jgi:hypothetical protein